MKLVELDRNNDHIIYEYENCRFTVSINRPLHLCIVSFDNGKPVSPDTNSCDKLIKYFFMGRDYCQASLFNVGLHVYEKTPFTLKIIGE